MKLGVRLERASSLYGSGMVVVAAGLLSYIASGLAAFVIVGALQVLFGWSNDRTEGCLLVLSLLILPLPLGAFLTNRATVADLAARSAQDRRPV